MRTFPTMTKLPTMFLLVLLAAPTLHAFTTTSTSSNVCRKKPLFSTPLSSSSSISSSTTTTTTSSDTPTTPSTPSRPRKFTYTKEDLGNSMAPWATNTVETSTWDRRTKQRQAQQRPAVGEQLPYSVKPNPMPVGQHGPVSADSTKRLSPMLASNPMMPFFQPTLTKYTDMLLRQPSGSDWSVQEAHRVGATPPRVSSTSTPLNTRTRIPFGSWANTAGQNAPAVVVPGSGVYASDYSYQGRREGPPPNRNSNVGIDPWWRFAPSTSLGTDSTKRGPVLPNFGLHGVPYNNYNSGNYRSRGMINSYADGLKYEPFDSFEDYRSGLTGLGRAYPSYGNANYHYGTYGGVSPYAAADSYSSESYRASSHQYARMNGGPPNNSNKPWDGDYRQYQEPPRQQQVPANSGTNNLEDYPLYDDDGPEYPYHGDQEFLPRNDEYSSAQQQQQQQPPPSTYSVPVSPLQQQPPPPPPQQQQQQTTTSSLQPQQPSPSSTAPSKEWQTGASDESFLAAWQATTGGAGTTTARGGDSPPLSTSLRNTKDSTTVPPPTEPTQADASRSRFLEQNNGNQQEQQQQQQQQEDDPPTTSDARAWQTKESDMPPPGIRASPPQQQQSYNSNQAPPQSRPPPQRYAPTNSMQAPPPPQQQRYQAGPPNPTNSMQSREYAAPRQASGAGRRDDTRAPPRSSNTGMVPPPSPYEPRQASGTGRRDDTRAPAASRIPGQAQQQPYASSSLQPPPQYRARQSPPSSQSARQASGAGRRDDTRAPPASSSRMNARPQVPPPPPGIRAPSSSSSSSSSDRNYRQQPPQYQQPPLMTSGYGAPGSYDLPQEQYGQQRPPLSRDHLVRSSSTSGPGGRREYPYDMNGNLKPGFSKNSNDPWGDDFTFAGGAAGGGDSRMYGGRPSYEDYPGARSGSGRRYSPRQPPSESSGPWAPPSNYNDQRPPQMQQHRRQAPPPPQMQQHQRQAPPPPQMQQHQRQPPPQQRQAPSQQQQQRGAGGGGSLEELDPSELRRVAEQLLNENRGLQKDNQDLRTQQERIDERLRNLESRA